MSMSMCVQPVVNNGLPQVTAHTVAKLLSQLQAGLILQLNSTQCVQLKSVTMFAYEKLISY